MSTLKCFDMKSGKYKIIENSLTWRYSLFSAVFVCITLNYAQFDKPAFSEAESDLAKAGPKAHSIIEGNKKGEAYKRYRIVKFDKSLIKEKKILLNLFEDTKLKIISDVIEIEPGKTIWMGHVDDESGSSSIILFIRDDSVQGRIQYGKSIFRIEDLGNGFSTVIEDDVAKMGPEEDMPVLRNGGKK
jgi:hypothetical protein